MYRCDRKGRIGEGVAILKVKNDILRRALLWRILCGLRLDIDLEDVFTGHQV